MASREIPFLTHDAIYSMSFWSVMEICVIFTV